MKNHDKAKQFNTHDIITHKKSNIRLALMALAKESNF